MRDQDSIVLRISRSYPIELEKLTFSMMSLGAQYELFIRREHPNAQDHEVDLLVNRITEGSIVIELFGAVQPLFQGMDNILIFKQFVEMIGAKLSVLSRPDGRLEDATSRELKDITRPNRENGVLMRLFQTNIGAAEADRASGEKGIIESLSEHPRRLIYASDLAGQRIKGAWSDQGINPYELGFTVDIDTSCATCYGLYKLPRAREILPCVVFLRK